MACLSISLASLCLLAAFCAVPGGAERTAASLPVPQRRRRSHRLAQGRHDVVEARCELVRDRGNEQKRQDITTTAQFFSGVDVSVQDLARYNVSHMVGRGQMSVGVAAAVDLQTGEAVVIKRMNPAVDRFQAERLLRELMIHRRLTRLGAAVVHLRGVLIPASDTSAFVVMERMDADLRQVRRAASRWGLRRHKLVAFQALAGLRDIHAAGYVHGDVKMNNVLMRADCTTRLADFGMSKPIKDPIAHKYKQHYRPSIPMSRRLVDDVGYMTAADIWHAGLVLLEMASDATVLAFPRYMTLGDAVWAWQREYGPPPAEVAEWFPEEVHAVLQQGAPPPGSVRSMEELFPRVAPEVMNFAKRLLSWDLRGVPTAQELLDDPFFDDVRSDPLVVHTHPQEAIAPKLSERHWKEDFNAAVRALAREA